jgi:hypothetical protein
MAFVTRIDVLAIISGCFGLLAVLLQGAYLLKD